MSKSNPFPGYRALSNQVYIFEPPGHAQSDDPETVIIYAWGDGHPKHIIKYADGYQILFPHSRIIIAQSTLLGSIYQTVSARTNAMIPVARSAGILPDSSSSQTTNRVLVQIMSNSGTVSFIATLLAYKMFDKAPFPCKLVVFDSAPGSISLVKNFGRWSRALAVAASSRIPLPVAFMQVFWVAILLLGEGLQRLTRWPAVGRLFPGPIFDPEFVSESAMRLFLYSKVDELVSCEDIENQVGHWKKMDHTCRTERFDESPHVGHMRMYPRRYWDAIAEAWKAANV